MFGLDIKNTSRRRRSGDFLCQSRKNIPSPHVTLWQAAYTCPLVVGTPDSNGFPGLKARENINGLPSCCDGIGKNIPLRKEAGADPQKEVCRYDMDMQDHSLRHCSLRWLLYKPRVAGRSVNSGCASVRTTAIPGDASRNTDNSRSVLW